MKNTALLPSVLEPIPGVNAGHVKHLVYGVLNSALTRLEYTYTDEPGGCVVSALTALKRHGFWVGMLLLMAAICTIAALTPSTISHLELRREAQVAADRLRAQLMKEPGTWIDALEYPAGALD